MTEFANVGDLQNPLDYADTLETIGLSDLDDLGIGVRDEIDKCESDGDIVPSTLAFDDTRVPCERIAGRRQLFPHQNVSHRTNASNRESDAARLRRERLRLAKPDESVSSPYTMTIHEAIAHYGKSNQTIYAHCRQNDGLVPFLRVGCRWILLRPRPFPASVYHALLLKKLRSQRHVGLQITADLYNISVRSLFDICRRGDSSLPHIKIGNRCFVSSRMLLTQLRIDDPC